MDYEIEQIGEPIGAEALAVFWPDDRRPSALIASGSADEVLIPADTLRIRRAHGGLEETLIAPPGAALLVMATTGSVEVASAEGQVHCARWRPFLHGAPEAVTLRWAPAAQEIVIGFRREAANHAASLLMGDGRRLLASGARLATIDPGSELAVLLRRAIAEGTRAVPLGGDAASLLSSRFYAAFAGFCSGPAGIAGQFASVRSVSEAMRLVRENHAEPYDVDGLASLVGVTAQTLRKSFRACLGTTIKDHIASVRLDWAQARLASARDSSPIDLLARRAGFTDGAHFSRSYVRRFGEAPSVTRARAVRNAV